MVANAISGCDTMAIHVRALMSSQYSTFIIAAFSSSVVGQSSVESSVPGSKGVHVGSLHTGPIVILITVYAVHDECIQPSVYLTKFPSSTGRPLRY